MKKSKDDNNIIDPSFLQFSLMRRAYYDNHITDKTEKEESENTVDSKIEKYQDMMFLDLAEVWVKAYSKSKGQQDVGLLAFDSEVSSSEFDRGMHVARIMQGRTLEEFVDRITVEFAYGNQVASEAIIYFMAEPAISRMFQIDCTRMSVAEAEYKKDKILAENTSESLAAKLHTYHMQEQGKPIVEEKKEEGQKQTNSDMPKLTVHDFSPKKMYDLYGNVDFDGNNLIIIGPDGETFIDEKPDPNVVKVAMINRIWKVTCINMDPDPTDESIAEINKTLFVGDNAIILNQISKMLLQDGITKVDTILKTLVQIDGVENESAFIHKAFDFLSNLAQFGEMDLDFNGVLPRKAYIEMMQEKSADIPEMTFTRKDK